jgi:hypothetical protein
MCQPIRRLASGFYAMIEPFVKMDATNKKLLALLVGLMIFGVIAIHIQLNETVATGAFIGTLLAGSRFLVKPRVQVKENKDTHCTIG